MSVLRQGLDLVPALLFSAALLALAPFLGSFRRELRELLSESGFVLYLGLFFAVCVVVALMAAVARIRENRRARWSLVGVWVLMMLGQLVFWSRSTAEENAAERLHFVLYSVVSVLFYLGFRHRGDLSAALLALLSGTLVGVLDEGVQWLMAQRVADFFDLFVNAWAAFAGLFLGVAIWPFARSIESVSEASRRWVAALAVLLFVTTAIYVETAHLGVVVEAPEIGTEFRSYFTREELIELQKARHVEWRENPPGRPQDMKALDIEDYYRSEGGWRVQVRNESYRSGDLDTAWMENLILETYYEPFLELPDRAGNPFRLPRRRRAEIESTRPGLEPSPYVSPVGIVPRDAIWLRPTRLELWTATGVLSLLVWWLAHRRGSSRP